MTVVHLVRKLCFDIVGMSEARETPFDESTVELVISENRITLQRYDSTYMARLALLWPIMFYLPALPPFSTTEELDRIIESLFQNHSEFFWTPYGVDDSTTIAIVMYSGAFPMVVDIEDKHVSVLAPKIHRSRCVIRLSTRMHTSRKAKKLGRRCFLSIGQDFDGVVSGIVNQHLNTWIVQEYISGLKCIFLNPGKFSGVTLHSIELWEDDKLIAGELGYSVGSIYTSLSGFHTKNNSGTVQMLALGKTLRKRGFEVWDLGMSLKYKIGLGAIDIDRHSFIKMFRTSRYASCSLGLHAKFPVELSSPNLSH